MTPRDVCGGPPAPAVQPGSLATHSSATPPGSTDRLGSHHGRRQSHRTTFQRGARPDSWLLRATATAHQPHLTRPSRCARVHDALRPSTDAGVSRICLSATASGPTGVQNIPGAAAAACEHCPAAVAPGCRGRRQPQATMSTGTAATRTCRLSETARNAADSAVAGDAGVRRRGGEGSVPRQGRRACVVRPRTDAARHSRHHQTAASHGRS